MGGPAAISALQAAVVVVGGLALVAAGTAVATYGPDYCSAAVGLSPGTNARWHIPRPPFFGQITLGAAAYRLDAGIAPPPGSAVSAPARGWVQSIGKLSPLDDAGHAIARRFGGNTAYNSVNGNLFPQNRSINRSGMRVVENVIAGLHRTGFDTCSVVVPLYSPTALRPNAVVYQVFVRRGVSSFVAAPPVLLPNP